MDRAFLDAIASEMSSYGNPEQEQVFQELRERALSPIEAIYVASRILRMSLPDAKTAIYASPAWSDQREKWLQTQSDLEGR